jgi:hypothetical protein
VRASGKTVRGREEPGPDPQELLQDTDNDGTSDDESVSYDDDDDDYGQMGSRIRQAWFLLVLSWRAFRAFVACGFL